MGIKDDILFLKNKQDNFFLANGRYIQALPTPVLIPTKGDVTSFTELNKPDDETVKLTFTPTAKDYQFFIHVSSYRDKSMPRQFGYYIHARRKLAANVLEEITYRKKLDNE